MLKIVKDILDSKTHKELQEICKDFDNRNFDNINYQNNNNYVRLSIPKNSLKDYIINAKKYLIENLPHDKTNMIDFESGDSWINKVAIETNKNDPYHKDISFLTLITYLNDDFEGGEFMYINDAGKQQLISPETNMTLVMDNKLSHKVMGVNSGIRFSLITFFKFKEKKSKTLL
jgi:Rps23 Pro-64 3,4-dihydroxylase Tpa1-like proline 4-hydroxylase